jgi:hypothetical protein
MIKLRNSGAGWRGCLAASLLTGMLLAGLPPARGQLVLTNFSATHPVNVMFIGDSITDDCQTVGAWRSFIQPILDTNNFPWRAVGRWLSPLTQSGIYTNFPATKALYEAYCGITIAAPGVTSGQHGYNNQAVFYLDYIIHDALTNAAGSGTNTPDLFCVYIGVNDIGHGRDPFFVATNDMPGFLNLLWSNAPNATVMLCKSSSVEGTGAHSGQYQSNSPNTVIYGAALQAMVNQQRAQGKKLFLADAFSVLQPVTTNLYKSDLEHPNAPAGLALVAREFATRIEAITIRTNSLTTTLIYGGEDWKYSDTGTDLGATGWTQLNYDDSLWSHGISRLGYGSTNVATPVSYGPDPANKYITTYFRHKFIVPPDTGITNLDFRLTRADGAVVYLNGQEVYRSNLHPTGPVAYSDLALARTVETNFTQAGFLLAGTNLVVSRNPAYRFYASNVVVSALLPGTNIVTVEVHQSSVTNSLMGFDLELLGSGARYPKPALSASVSGGNVNVTWPAANTAPYTLYFSADPGAGWSVSPAPLQTNGGQVVATVPTNANTTFFRLQGSYPPVP